MEDCVYSGLQPNAGISLLLSAYNTRFFAYLLLSRNESRDVAEFESHLSSVAYGVAEMVVLVSIHSLTVSAVIHYW